MHAVREEEVFFSDLFAALVSWHVLRLGTGEINEPNVLNWRFNPAAVVVSGLAAAAGLWEQHNRLGHSVTARWKSKESAIYLEI